MGVEKADAMTTNDRTMDVRATEERAEGNMTAGEDALLRVEDLHTSF